MARFVQSCKANDRPHKPHQKRETPKKNPHERNSEDYCCFSQKFEPWEAEVVALGISNSKMLLVVLFFMRGRYERAITWIFITAGVIWFLIMVGLTLSDYLTRGDVAGTRQSWRHAGKNPPPLTPGGPEEKTESVRE
jgi:caa(3)-type oxidase subunit IV